MNTCHQKQVHPVRNFFCRTCSATSTKRNTFQPAYSCNIMLYYHRETNKTSYKSNTNISSLTFPCPMHSRVIHNLTCIHPISFQTMYFLHKLYNNLRTNSLQQVKINYKSPFKKPKKLADSFAFECIMITHRAFDTSLPVHGREWQLQLA